MSEETRHELRVYAGVWLALMLLLALTVVSAQVPMGLFNVVANIGIAVAKTVLVMLFFMHLLRAGHLVRLVALIGFLWLALLIVLTVADFLTRHVPQVNW